MIDRRALMRLGLASGLSLAGPAAALAAAHKPSRTHRTAAHAPAHTPRLPDLADQPAGPFRYEPLHVEPVRFATRRLSLMNLHTDETLDAVYWENGRYVPDALEAVNRVLRDFRTGDVHPMDPRLLDVVADLHVCSGSTSPFQVLSGFRSPATNAMLREKSGEVAQRSLHMDGMAIDLYLDDVDLDRLHEAALDLSRGGVGYYPVTKFIHVDVGPVRHWQGA